MNSIMSGRNSGIELKNKENRTKAALFLVCVVKFVADGYCVAVYFRLPLGAGA